MRVRFASARVSSCRAVFRQLRQPSRHTHFGPAAAAYSSQRDKLGQVAHPRRCGLKHTADYTELPAR